MLTVVAQYFGETFDEPGGPGTRAGLDADVREDLVGSLVGDGLGLQKGGDLGLDRVALGLLEEENAIGEILVVGPDLRVDLLVGAEVGLGGEDHGDQREFGLVDGNVVPAEGVDQAAIEVFEQAAAVLGERAGRLVKDQVMVGLQELVIDERTVVFVKQGLELVRAEGLERLVGRNQRRSGCRAGRRAGSGRSCRRTGRGAARRRTGRIHRGP